MNACRRSCIIQARGCTRREALLHSTHVGRPLEFEVHAQRGRFVLARTVSALGVILVLALGVGNGWSSTIRVPEDFATIGEAIESADPGDSISVAGGQYPGSLVITRPLHLVSRERRGAEIIAGTQGTHVIHFEKAGGPCTVQGFKINGEVRSSSGIDVDESSIRILDNEIVKTTTAIFLRKSEGEIADNDLNDNVGCSIHLRGSSPTIVRNVILDRVSAAILLIGKKTTPVIGGSPGNGNVFGPGQEISVRNETKNDINARYNQWNWSSTVEMNSRPFPSDVSGIFDKIDDPRFGSVDYGDWVAADSPSGSSRGSTVLIVVVAAAGAIVVTVVFARRARRSPA